MLKAVRLEDDEVGDITKGKILNFNYSETGLNYTIVVQKKNKTGIYYSQIDIPYYNAYFDITKMSSVFILEKTVKNLLNIGDSISYTHSGETKYMIVGGISDEYITSIMYKNNALTSITSISVKGCILRFCTNSEKAELYEDVKKLSPVFVHKRDGKWVKDYFNSVSNGRFICSGGIYDYCIPCSGNEDLLKIY